MGHASEDVEGMENGHAPPVEQIFAQGTIASSVLLPCAYMGHSLFDPDALSQFSPPLRGRLALSQFLEEGFIFRNLVNKSFGPGFAASNITVTFLCCGDQEVCQIDIKRALQPQYLEVKDKNGNKSQKFYVRNGNSSIELPLPEVSSYVQSHFHQMACAMR